MHKPLDLRRRPPSLIPLAERTRPLKINVKHDRAIYLYAVYCKGFAKIGITQDVNVRVGAMQSGCPFPLQLLDAFPLRKSDAEQAEFQAAKVLQSSHVRGEWFRCNKSHVRYVLTSIAKTYPATPITSPIKPDLRINMLKPVDTPDGRFPSRTAAAQHFGISLTAVAQRVARGDPGWRSVW